MTNSISPNTAAALCKGASSTSESFASSASTACGIYANGGLSVSSVDANQKGRCSRLRRGMIGQLSQKILVGMHGGAVKAGTEAEVELGSG
jgi:hypothetical protein